MHHNDNDFWQYAGLYILLSCSLIFILSLILDVVLLGKQLDLATAATGLVLRFVLLTSLKRIHASEESELTHTIHAQ